MKILNIVLYVVAILSCTCFANASLNNNIYNYKIAYEVEKQDTNAFGDIVKRKVEITTTKTVGDLLKTDAKKYYKGVKVEEDPLMKNLAGKSKQNLGIKETASYAMVTAEIDLSKLDNPDLSKLASNCFDVFTLYCDNNTKKCTIQSDARTGIKCSGNGNFTDDVAKFISESSGTGVKIDLLTDGNSIFSSVVKNEKLPKIRYISAMFMDLKDKSYERYLKLRKVLPNMYFEISGRYHDDSSNSSVEIKSEDHLNSIMKKRNDINLTKANEQIQKIESAKLQTKQIIESSKRFLKSDESGIKKEFLLLDTLKQSDHWAWRKKGNKTGSILVEYTPVGVTKYLGKEIDSKKIQNITMEVDKFNVNCSDSKQISTRQGEISNFMISETTYYSSDYSIVHVNDTEKINIPIEDSLREKICARQDVDLENASDDTPVIKNKPKKKLR
jgi:hypothetical protein